MKKNKTFALRTRVPVEIGQAIDAMTTKARSRYQVLCDIITSFVRDGAHPPLREETLDILYHTMQVARYDDVDSLVQDLCHALERTIAANRGELQDSDDAVDIDIIEMFNAVVNEKELTIHKYV